MSAEVNKVITGEYDHVGKAIIYGDTDSEIGSTIHVTNKGEQTVEELFESCTSFQVDGDKEYGFNPDLKVMGYDQQLNQPYFDNINYIYRHAVSKDLYEITDNNNNQVTVTEDHSVMVERDSCLIETKPKEIKNSDILISLKINDAFLNEITANTKKDLQFFNNCVEKNKISVSKSPVKSVKKIRTAENEYVYDIGMKNETNPWFFGNRILLHNSVYFSAYPTLKEDIDAGKVPWKKETVIQLYDQICKQANESFQDFMLKSFHCPKSRSGVIAAGREVVAESGLFITKKRYALLVYDDEGTRKDLNNSPGKVKAMGLDLRRSDTPVYMQEFLMEILLMVLQSYEEKHILDRIVSFRQEFKQMPGWEKGSPKRANKIGQFQREEERKGKANMPGHVRASINWNTLKRMNNDRYSQDIVDGMKVIVCKLKSNPLGYTSVAYPTDELRLPEWFKELPFDDSAMAETIIDNKLDNLIGVLNIDLEDTKRDNTFNSLFDFGD